MLRLDPATVRLQQELLAIRERLAALASRDEDPGRFAAVATLFAEHKEELDEGVAFASLLGRLSCLSGLDNAAEVERPVAVFDSLLNQCEARGSAPPNVDLLVELHVERLRTPSTRERLLLHPTEVRYDDLVVDREGWTLNRLGADVVVSFARYAVASGLDARDERRALESLFADLGIVPDVGDLTALLAINLGLFR